MHHPVFIKHLLIATLLSIVFSCRGQVAEDVIDLSLTSEVRVGGIIEAIMKKEKLPGMAVEVWKDGVSVFSKGYGYADKENKIAVNPKTSMFRIGSISKPFTAVALGKLYEAGLIDLDAPVQKYVPAFPHKEHAVSIRQLAGHLGGIRHYKGMEFMSKVHYPTIGEGLDIFADDPLINEPGNQYSYSSYGWNLISAAIESAAQQDFLTYMQEQVFDEIGLEHTAPDYANQDIPNRVIFYDKNFLGMMSVAPEVDNSYKWAGGGFLSSAHDVAKLAQAHLDASILSAETIALWTKSQQTNDGKSINYGIGWRSGEDKKGRPWYGHGGGSVGGTSLLIVFPEEKLIVVTTVNLGNAKTGNLAFRIADQFF